VLQTQYLVYIPKAIQHIHGKPNKCQLHQNSIWRAHEIVRHIFPFPNLLQTASTEIERVHQESERNHPKLTALKLQADTQGRTQGSSLSMRHAPSVRVPLRRADAAFGQQASIRIYVSHKQKIKGMETMKQCSQGRRHLENWICCPL